MEQGVYPVSEDEMGDLLARPQYFIELAADQMSGRDLGLSHHPRIVPHGALQPQ